MPAWFPVLRYVYQHGKWVPGSTCRPGLISARTTGEARVGTVLARARVDLGCAATAPVGLPRCCRCTDPSTWVGWARGTPRLGGAAPFTGTPTPTGARKSKMGPKRLFRGFRCRIRPCGGDQGRSGHLLGSLRCVGSLGMSFENSPKFRFLTLMRLEDTCILFIEDTTRNASSFHARRATSPHVKQGMNSKT